MNFKEQLKAQILNVAAAAEAEVKEGTVKPGCSTVPPTKFDIRPMLKANEKPSNLPLNSTNPLAAAMAAAAAMKDKVTPQQALAHTMAAIHQKAQEMTGVAVPSYYNPAAVNPLKYAEQLKKRKLLWSKTPKETPDQEKETDVKTAQSVAQWTGSSFAADSDGKMAAKFCKLMGIKEQDKNLLSDNVDLSKLTEEQRQRQAELFEQLDKEYAFARMTTHTRRGVGLGFGLGSMPEMP